jgi:hypothetical protein
MRKVPWRRDLTGALLLTAALALVGCGSGRTDEGADGTGTSVVQELPDTTVVGTAPESTTSAAPPPAGTIPFYTEPASGISTGDAEGSGCAPPSMTSLPDGIWFGIAVEIDPDADTIGLDLACLRFATSVDGRPTEDGYWVRNESPNVYLLRTVPDVAVGLVPESFRDGQSLVPAGDGLDAALPAIDRGVWVQVVDGWVVAIQQQYFP